MEESTISCKSSLAERVHFRSMDPMTLTPESEKRDIFVRCAIQTRIKQGRVLILSKVLESS